MSTDALQLITKAKAKNLTPEEFIDDTVDEHRIICGQIFQCATHEPA